MLLQLFWSFFKIGGFTFGGDLLPGLQHFAADRADDAAAKSGHAQLRRDLRFRDRRMSRWKDLEACFATEAGPEFDPGFPAGRLDPRTGEVEDVAVRDRVKL